LRIDPRRYLAGVDFSQLPAGTSAGSYVFGNDPSGAGYFQLYTNLHQTAPYTFSWTDLL
jgi:hypothetical protein